MMNVVLSVVLLAVLASGLVLPLTEHSVYAQAPTGPQSEVESQQGTTPPPPALSGQRQKPPEAGVTIAVDVPVVTLDVVAVTQHGDILTGLKKENFRILDDGVPQTITNFGPTDAPITMVVLMQFGGNEYGWFASHAKHWADALFPNLQPKDMVALETFDLRTRLEVDFTQNKDEVPNATPLLSSPRSTESNVFDAILETRDRLK